MPSSQALQSFLMALDEVAFLEAASPTQAGGAPRKPQITRAVGRAGIVLLTSHFERYVYAINEEAVMFLNSRSVSEKKISNSMKLLHSKRPIDDIASMQWDRREEKMRELMLSDGWLWNNTLTGVVDPDRLLEWMRSPKPKNLIRYYRYWGIENIFEEITRKQSTKTTSLEPSGFLTV